jgi:hypothetical protein
MNYTKEIRYRNKLGEDYKEIADGAGDQKIKVNLPIVFLALCIVAVILGVISGYTGCNLFLYLLRS